MNSSDFRLSKDTDISRNHPPIQANLDGEYWPKGFYELTYCEVVVFYD